MLFGEMHSSLSIIFHCRCIAQWFWYSRVVDWYYPWPCTFASRCDRFRILFTQVLFEKEATRKIHPIWLDFSFRYSSVMSVDDLVSIISMTGRVQILLFLMQNCGIYFPTLDIMFWKFLLSILNMLMTFGFFCFISVVYERNCQYSEITMQMVDNE